MRSGSISQTGRRAMAAVLLSWLGWTASAEAKTLYVNGSTGNDSTSYAANSSTTPWRSIGRAAWGSTNRSAPNGNEAARAGDVVRISAGTYTTVGNLTGGGFGRFDVAYNPVNEGVAGSPIRFEAVGTVVLTYSNGAGPMIGSNERDNIEWSGFTISETTAPTRSDTGPVIFFNVTGGSIESSVLTGNPNWTARVGDNYSGVRLEDARGVRIANNRIRDYGGQSLDRNHNGIETYRAFPLTIENNEITNCGAGIYLKAVRPDGTGIDNVIVRYNVFVNSRWGLHVLQQPMTQQRPLLAYQNLFVNQREAAFWINQFDNGVQNARWVRFFNNTIVSNATSGLVSGIATFNAATYPAGSNFLMWNNIVVGGTHSVRQDTTNVALSNSKDRHDFEHNVYFGFSSGFGDLGGNNVSLSVWQSTYGQDAANAAAIQADPRFVNPSAGDYRLQSTSPARTIGRALYGIGGGNGAVIPAGAYITGSEAIGPTTGYTPPPPPPTGGSNPPGAPTNLRIVS